MIMRRVGYLLPLLVFLVVVTYFAVSLRPGHDIHELPSAMVEKPAPGFALAGLGHASLADGNRGDASRGEAEPLALEALKGHPFVINFFASWCVPCRVEHPVLMRLAGQEHLPLYGIAYKDKPADAARLLAAFGDPYRRIGLDRDGRVGLDFGVYGVPETYVIDAAGRIRRRFVGPLTAASVEQDLLPLFRRLAGS